MRWLTVCLFLISASLADAFFGLFNLHFSDPTWDTVRVKYTVPFMNFNEMPLTKDEAISKQFVEVKEGAACDAGPFRGYRYYKDSSPSVIMIYDKNGYFAGIQTGFPESDIDATLKTWYGATSTFQSDTLADGTKAYFLTAYFVDPATICKTGRNNKDFRESQGGARRFTIQNGPQPETNLIDAPIKQSDISGTPWTKGKCFASMGTHYWYKTSKDMDCNNFVPAFLLYNEGELTGFGWATFGNFNNGGWYEHPPGFLFRLFMNPVPTCLDEMYSKVGVSTQHVYLNYNPLNMVC